MRARLTLAVLLALETGAVVLVVRCGAPAPLEWSDPVGGLGRTDPETATLVVGRWLVLLVAAWLLLSTVLALGARIVAVAPGTPRGVRRLGRAIGRCTPGALRHLVEAAVAVGVVAATVTPAAATPGSGPVPRAPVAARPPVTPLGPVRDGRVPAAATPASDPPAPPSPPASAPPAPTPAPPSPDGSAGAPGTHHRVVAGEHLWGIAEAVVRAQGGHDDPVAIDRYWRALCDANRGHLASGDPNIVVPGEDIDLPPVA